MMNCTVRVLTLYKDLCYALDASSDSIDNSTDKSNFLYRYTCKVAPKELEPRLSRFLTKPRFEGYALGKTEGIGNKTGIPAGLYLFLQGFMPVKELHEAGAEENPQDKAGQKKRLNVYRLAAEHLHNEALWKEIDFCDDIVYIRTLKEGKAEVFQLFRKIRAEKTD